MPQLADAFARTQDADMRERAARALFGKSGGSLLPMLNKGSAEMRELAEKWAGIKYPFTKEDDKNLQAYNDEMQLLKATVLGTTDAVGAKLSPALLPVVRGMRMWLLANRDWLASKIKENIEDLTRRLKEVDWERLGSNILWVFRNIRDAIDAVGGFGRVIEILIGLKVARWALGFIAGLVRITREATLARAALIGVRDAALAAGSSEAFAPLLGRLATMARVLGPIAAAIAVMWPAKTAAPEDDEAPKDKRPRGMPESGKLSRQIYRSERLPHWEWHIARRPSPDDTSHAVRFQLPGTGPVPGAPNGLRPPGFGPQLPTTVFGLPSRDTQAAPVRLDLPRLAPLPGSSVSRQPADLTPLIGPRDDRKGDINLRIDINNLPPGSKVATTTNGAAPAPEVNVGYAAPAFGY